MAYNNYINPYSYNSMYNNPQMPINMSMLYSDFEEVLGDNADLYLKMACAYIDDPDADEGKVFRIWKSRYVP